MSIEKQRKSEKGKQEKGEKTRAKKREEEEKRKDTNRRGCESGNYVKPGESVTKR